jgi:phosphohistidine phosphatase
MKEILILRHAKSSWKFPNLSDHERPLNKRGKRDAPRIGKLIKYESMLPNLILSSTARRAIETAEAVTDESGYMGTIFQSRRLYHGGPDDYIDEVKNLSNDISSIMVVGHNPGLEELVETLSGKYEILPTATLVQIRLPIQDWVDVSCDHPGELIGIWRPKELD